MIKGRLHSIESFGAVDGPGIRTVFFMQGCPARCSYCHNPDTWNPNEGKEVTVEEVVRKAKRGMPYYGNDGGVTFSGGEPLLQGEFLIEAMKTLKENGIESAVDTSGTYFDDNSEAVINQADMVLLDIKHINSEKFKELTGREQSPLLKLIEVINKLEKPIWVRQVILPGLNDNEEYVEALNTFLSSIKTVRKIELIGYHNMAENKYEKLGLKYKLLGLKPMNREKLERLSSLTKSA